MTTINAIRTKFSETGPLMVFNSFWDNRSLVNQMARREIALRYRGSLIGFLWAVINPMLLLGVYTFVFGVILKAGGDGGIADFALMLFAGLIVFQLFSECVTQATTIIMSNVNFVKKVIFPLEILPWITLCVSLFHAAISMAVLVFFYLVVNQSLNWTVVFVPVVIVPLLLFTLGFSWFLASIGTYIRDATHVVSLMTMVMMFMTPIFYPLSVVPEFLRPIYLYVNPLTFIVIQVRDVVLFGQMPNWPVYGISFAASFIIAWLGLAWFQMTRGGFSDVL